MDQEFLNDLQKTISLFRNFLDAIKIAILQAKLVVLQYEKKKRKTERLI